MTWQNRNSPLQLQARFGEATTLLLYCTRQSTHRASTASLQLERWVSFIFYNKAGNDIKCLMPWNMCWDPVCNVAEVWCLVLFWALFVVLTEIYTWTHLLQCIVVVWSSLRMLKLYLLRGGRTLCQGVWEHGLNLHQNIPLIKPDWTGTELNRTCENPVEPGVT